jgi:hypothetical protein
MGMGEGRDDEKWIQRFFGQKSATLTFKNYDIFNTDNQTIYGKYCNFLVLSPRKPGFRSNSLAKSPLRHPGSG